MNVGIALKAVLATAALLTGCTTAGKRIEQRARAAGLTTIQVDGAFATLIYMKHARAAEPSGGPLLVFLEGDGVPWRNGMRPSEDPTTMNPVALDLLLRSPGPAAYVTRPCYHGLRSGPCTTSRWTDGRYSSEIVASMAATVREAQRHSNTEDVVLIGYSGGGVLAVLVAEQLEDVSAVMTIAANLDTDAWAAHHGYLPLSQSLNPSRSDLPHRWPELHLQGGADRIVPGATTNAYFERYPQARRRSLEGFDHVCCWVRDWEALLRELPQQPAVN